MDLSTQQKYYNFFPNLIEMSKEEKYCKTFSMTPDVCLIVNNWRLLHGRQSYILQVHNIKTDYLKVASSRMSWLVARPSIFRIFMKGKFDAYVP